MRTNTQYKLLAASIIMIPLFVMIITFASKSIDATKKNDSMRKVSLEFMNALKSNDWTKFTSINEIQRLYDVKIAIIDSTNTVVYSAIPIILSGDSILDIFNSLHKDKADRYNYILLSDSGIRNTIPYKMTVIIQAEKNRWTYALSNNPWDYVIASMLIMLLFSVIIMIKLLYSFTHAVTKLDEETKNFSISELDKTICITGNDEIRSLVKSFNTMRSAIKMTNIQRTNFVMGISHDFKTPLTLIKGYAEIILHTTPTKNVKQTTYLNNIGIKVEQLESMIDDLIDYLSIEINDWQESSTKVNFPSWITRYIDRCYNDAKLLEKKLECNIDIPENTLVYMNEKLIERVLENLVQNAFRYTCTGGILRFDAIYHDHIIRLKISDNGPGIAEKDLPFIFDMFYRASPSRQTPGMGLGLSIVKNILEAHGWPMKVASTIDIGTTFEISIPTVKSGDSY